MTPLHVALILLCAFGGMAIAQTRQFVITNNCAEAVWIAGAGSPTPIFNGSSGGLELPAGATVTTSLPTPWVGGRFWGRRQCTFDANGKGSCQTGDCGGLQCQHAGAGNTSLAEFTLTGSATGADNYDISLVDGFDFPLSVQLNDPDPAHAINAACQVDLRSSCPVGQQMLDSSGQVVGCKSLCSQYGTANYCCAGPYGSPQACNNVNWDTNYRGAVLKQSCPSVYGYAFDDPSSDFNVAPLPSSGYQITFCPANNVPNSNPAIVPTFTITSQEPSETVTPGGSVAYNLNVTASSTFTGTVKLSAAHLPGSCTWTTAGKVSCSNKGSSASFSTSSVSLTPGVTVPVILTVNTTTTPFPMLGAGNIEVIGQSGALENVWEGSLTVVNPTAPDYAFRVTPTSAQTVQPGTPVVYTVKVTPVNGFTGVVSMSTSGLPATSTSLTLPQFTFTGDPTPQSATITIATSASAAKRAYFPLFTSFSANSLHDAQVALTVSSTAPSPDFTVSVTPPMTTLQAGNSASFTITATSESGFSSTVTLSATSLPVGVTATFTPDSISEVATSSLTVATSASTLPGTYIIPVTATSGSLSHTTNISLAVNAAGVQFTDLDIGDPGTAGTFSANGGTFTVGGSGSDIFGTADQFNYAYQSASGDFTVIAHVDTQTDTDEWAKSGVMARSTTAENAAFAAVFATPKHGVAMIARTADGGGTTDLGQAQLNVPAWVKLQRVGNTFTGYASPDGVNWTLISTKDVGMTGSVTAGLAVTSKRESTLNISTSDGVTIQ
ncbi:thaumatin family protein [Tunturibacter psychrotolerans]|uniref:Thaumatin family protein n=1 Tax=Tunturiibacter psychrotolerans TaxID=3069686 RepID=A0AAU7ZTV1_9BACT